MCNGNHGPKALWLYLCDRAEAEDIGRCEGWYWRDVYNNPLDPDEHDPEEAEVCYVCPQGLAMLGASFGWISDGEDGRILDLLEESAVEMLKNRILIGPLGPHRPNVVYLSDYEHWPLRKFAELLPEEWPEEKGV